MEKANPSPPSQPMRYGGMRGLNAKRSMESSLPRPVTARSGEFFIINCCVLRRNWLWWIVNPKKIPIWYRKWSNMIRRCYSPKTHNYKWYGGRGVTVCDRWRQRGYGPRNFHEDMGEPPAGMTLGRINNDLGYGPDNCRWETWKEQASSRRKGGPPINPDSIRQKAIKANLPYLVVIQRLRAGWSKEKALTTPKSNRSKRVPEETQHTISQQFTPEKGHFATNLEEFPRQETQHPPL